MPPASRACSGPDRARRGLALRWAVALAVLFFWLGLAAPLQAAEMAVQHIVRASMLEVPGGDVHARPPRHADAAALPGTWQDVDLPHQARRDWGAGDQPYVTRWFRLTLDDSAAPQERVLYLPRWQTIGRVTVYADGELRFHSRGGVVWNSFNMPLWVTLNPTAGEPPTREVLIRVVSQTGAGAGVSSAWVGPREELVGRLRVREALQSQIPFMASAAFLAIGLFALAVWARHRDDTAYLLFFVASVLFFVRCLHYHTGQRTPLIPEAWFGWITVNSLGWLLLCVYFFAFRLHERRLPWLERGALAVMALSTVLTLPGWASWGRADVITSAAYGVQFVVMLVVTLAALWMSWRSGSRLAIAVSAWNVLNIPVGLHDWMLQHLLISVEGIYLLPYTGIGLFFLFMLVVFQRYTGALAEARGARAVLAQRLQTREAELAQSYARLQAIAREQMVGQERQRLMQDMHDGLGSSLMSALHAVELGQLDEQGVAQVLRECIDDLKLAIDSLEPVQTDLLLLLATLRFRLEPRLQGSGLALEWAVEDVPPLPWLEPRSALHVLRIFQEVFTNVIKHARASRVRVSTMHDAHHVIVRVEDNGAGFEPDAAVLAAVAPGSAPRGKGLGNLLRRAAALRGHACWTRLPDGGTRFELRLPREAPLTVAD